MGTEFRAYKPETITRALANLRTQIIRDGGPGLEHVEALLQIRDTILGRCRARQPRRGSRGAS